MNDGLKEKIVYFDAETAKSNFSDAVSLNSLVKEKINEDEFNAIFGVDKSNDAYRHLNLKLDKKTKYIHDQNYYVKSYNSSDIFIDNGQIVYKQIEKMPSNISKEELVRRNLFAQAMLMISIYMGFVDNLNSKFVREHFSDFSQFIPDEDVGYYSGIIERNAGIYYSDFAKAKSERSLNEYKSDLEKSEKEENSSFGNGNNKTLTKSTAEGKIYAESEDVKPVAFVSVYFYAMITMVGFLLGVLYLFSNLLK